MNEEIAFEQQEFHSFCYRTPHRHADSYTLPCAGQVEDVHCEASPRSIAHQIYPLRVLKLPERLKRS